MSTGCVRSRSKTAEHRLNKQEHPYFRRKLSIVRSMLKHWMHQSETTKDVTDDEDTEMDSQKLRSSEDNQQDELGQKKPRRKDTPVLNSPPLIPGVRLMKGETRLIHFEDEEKETKK